MTAPLTPALQAIHSALTGDTDLMALTTAVYSRIPKGAEFPYVSYFPVDTIEDDAECIEGTRHTVQIDIWSRGVSPASAWEIEHRIKKILHRQSFNLPTHALAMIEFEASRGIDDPDGLTHHQAMTFTIAVEEN